MNVLSVLAQARALAAAEPVLEQSIPMTATGPSAERPSGTYWGLANNQPPMPFDPFPELPVYVVDPTNRIFLVDDRSVDFPGLRAQQEEQAQAVAMAGTMMAIGVPLPGDGGNGGGTNSYTFNASGFVLPDYGTNLWIRMDGISSGNMVGIMSNSMAGTPYEIQSCEDLLGAWSSEGEPVYGLETTNWTPFSVAMNGRANLFLRIKSWADSTGSGIPDWWWLQYFGSVGGDPFAFDPSGDGFTLWQAFVEGLNPTVFNTPAAPRGLTVRNNLATNQATIQWQPSPGPVTGYTVEKTYQPYFYLPPQISDFNVSASTNSYQDDISGNSPATYDSNYEVSYRVQAHYASGGVSAWSASVPLQQAVLSGSIGPGANGATYLLVSGLPENTATVRLVYFDAYASVDHYDTSFNTYRDIPISAFTNGVTLLPDAWQSAGVDAYGYDITPNQIQSIDINGNFSVSSWLSFIEWNRPIYDGRVQLKQNLIFQLRAATMDDVFHFSYLEYQNVIPVTYVYSGLYDFYNYGGGLYLPFLDTMFPFKNNYLFKNFVFDSSEMDTNGRITTGAGGDYNSFPNGLTLQEPAAYHFQPPATNWTTIPALLATNETRWLVSYPLDSDTYYLQEIGVTNYYETDWETYYNTFHAIIPNARNYFGLPFLSDQIAWDNNGGNALLSANNIVENIDGYFYPETAQPQFQVVEYDFWSPDVDNFDILPPLDTIPGLPGFSLTNTSRLMITSVGSSLTIDGYAKLAVTNGYPGVYAYLGQYFDQAYKEDTNGVATTNSTGFVTPYGHFFATEPGPAALVTMPDIDTGARGTCTVSVASVQVDKNSDGTMDLSFSGTDATSQASPFVLWVNSGHCKPGNNGNLDTDLPVPLNSPNYSYGKIRCQRNLENFFRLWVCGLPALPTSQGYTVTLSMSPSSGDPAINLYASYDTNGSAAYLTDTNAAQQQFTQQYLNGQLMFDYSKKLRTISSSQNYTLPVYSDGRPIFTHFLFEGACTNGSGELLLTISQNSNVVAQTGVWLDLHDIKDFYERAEITNNTSGAISNWSSGIQLVQPAISSTSGNDTNLIVFVHGINVGPWDWLDDSDTVFKRLYWAGYHGKFMTVKWPCNFLTPPSPVTLAVFNLSEANAYKASTSLTTYLNQLRSRFPGYRLNLYVHSQGNAVVSEAIKNGAPFDTYIITQGAISDGAYDVNAANDPVLVNEEYGRKITPQWQPMGYQGVYTNSNFSGKIVNFYNTNDPVLAVWIVDQVDLKPSGGYFYDGVNCRYTISTNIIVTDFQETRSMVSRSRSLSVGQSGPESAHGVIQSAVDLKTHFGFNNASFDDHSAQWAWPIQTTGGYYLQILTSINP